MSETSFASVAVLTTRVRKGKCIFSGEFHTEEESTLSAKTEYDRNCFSKSWEKIAETILEMFKDKSKLSNEIMAAGGRGRGERYSWGVWDEHIHTAMFKMYNQQGPSVQYMEFCSVLCGGLDGRGVWGRMDTCV